MTRQVDSRDERIYPGGEWGRGKSQKAGKKNTKGMLLV